jgi:cyclic pyranopterin phosphate synthase
VTDRCNLRCAYCLPVEPVWLPRKEILSFDEIARVARVSARCGVHRVRVTGGEPLLRRDLPELIRLLSSTPGIEDLSLTTNGVLLEDLAGPLAAAGLQRVNVSLDTLVPERFVRLTRRDLLGRVLAGLDAAQAAGLTPIKINTVLLRGVNDDEVERLVERGRARGWELRFIEFMPLENDASWDRKRVVSGDEIRERIAARWPLDPVGSADPHAPATRYAFRDGRGSVGFIDSVTRPFCATCSRIRLTADGRLRVCLYDDRETDLRGPLRDGATDSDLQSLFESALSRKDRGGALDILERERAIPLVRTMHQIGG